MIAAAAMVAAPEPPPAEPKGLFARLRDRLGKTKAGLVDKVRAALRLHGKVDEELLEEIEMILIQSDVGVATTTKIVDRLRKEARREGKIEADALLGLFKAAIEEILTANNRTLTLDGAAPRIVLVVGVNGTGKTTTIGKIAKQLTDRGRRVMMVAADTFRAAAIEQLTIWAERTGSCIVKQAQGADPAAVVFEALEGAKQEPPDAILIDTAGRLQTKTHLMEELKKIVRVIRKHYPDGPHETVLVLDATTGQNALSQIKLFHEACELTGVVMSKLDGTAKGGILVACKDLYPLPVFKIGIGEGVEDLRDFDPHEFVEALFAGSSNGDPQRDADAPPPLHCD
jgi:fused signal recognition particle receptor